MKRFAPFVLVFAASASFAPPARAQFVVGDLYVSDSNGDLVHRIEPGSWNVTTFADSTDGIDLPSATLLTPAGTLLCSSYFTDQIFEFDSYGTGTVLYDGTSGLVGPFGENGLAYDVNGDLFVSDYLGRQIVRFPAGGGSATVFAGQSAGISYPDGLAFAANGDLYVANRGSSKVLKFDTTGAVSTFDTLPGDPFSIAIRGNGDVYVAVSASPPAIYRYPGGDVAQRTKLASFTNNSGNPSLQLSVDGTKLYFTSGGTGDLWEVDSDAGTKTEVIPSGTLGNAIAITVIGAGHSASWANYGSGLAGTHGVPFFTSQNDPVLGSTITIDLGNSLGLPTSGFLVLGFQQASLHTGLGGDLLLIPALLVPISFSYGADSFSGTLPSDPAYIGVEVDLQAVEADPGAVKGYSFTQGLQLLLGW
jgi:sugar lactone lactonase YvrE